MNIEYRPNFPSGTTEEDIYLDGQKIGYVRTHNTHEENEYRCHAAINIDGGLSSSLIQGHGATKEAAIVAAIKRGREDFTRALISIDELERKLQLTPTPDPAPASAGGCGDPE